MAALGAKRPTAIGNGNLLSGIVETDEIYFLESFKGKRNLTIRKPRKRGGKASKRGISNEQVAVMVAISRDGGIVCRTLGQGGTTAPKIQATVGKPWIAMRYLFWFRLLEQSKDLGERSRRKKLLLAACRKSIKLYTRDFPLPQTA